MKATLIIKECGRKFNSREMDIIQNIIKNAMPSSLRSQIAREVCEQLDWRNAKGELKAMSCRVALLRMHRRGDISLPAPRNGNGNCNGEPLTQQMVQLPTQNALDIPAHELSQLELVLVDSRQESALWNSLIERYHYLGYRPSPGAQLRYLISSEQGLLGAIGWAPLPGK